MSRAEQSDDSTISWGDLEKAAGGDAKLTPTQKLGFDLFKWVIGLLGVLIVLATLYALLTWPRASELDDLLRGLPPDARAAALRTARADWHSDVRNFVQLLVIGPFVPILSAIIGYVLGKNESSDP